MIHSTTVMIEPSFEIYLAPLRGVTIRTFRNAFHRHFKGVDLAISPFIPTVHSPTIKPSLLKDVDLDKEQSIKLIPQIIGNHPEDIANMCLALNEMGYTEVNWNLGCPHRLVTRKKRGSGLLPHPEMIKNILDTVFTNKTLHFSIKTRLGLDNPDDLYNISKTINNYPIKEIIIHPRTGSQMYNGLVDITRFKQCIKEFDCPAVYNGDINHNNDFIRLQKCLPKINKWMIGRGLIANPFLAEDIKGITPPTTTKEERIKAFLEDLLSEYSKELYGPAHILGRMKELWKYLHLSFENGTNILRKIQQSSSVENYRQLTNNFLNENKFISEQTLSRNCI